MSAKQHYEVHGVLEKPLAPELSLAGKHRESRTELHRDTDSFTCFRMTHLVILRQHPPNRNHILAS